jgi:DNA-binding transcriptional LysR family regulator
MRYRARIGRSDASSASVFSLARLSCASPGYVQYVTQVHTILVLVRTGIGIALVPVSAATLHPDNTPSTQRRSAATGVDD